MPNFTLTLDLSALYASMAPSFEVLIDGVIEASFSVTSSYSTTDYSFSSASAVPNIQLRFKDDFSEAGRSILINDVQINGVSVAGSSIDKGMLLQQELANIDTTSESGSFGVIPPGGGTSAVAAPTIASFGGATDFGTAGNDIYLGGDIVDTELEVFDALGGDDVVRGHGNDDAIFLRAGNDRAYGGGGDDTLVGGTGDDLLKGDAGNDALWGEEDNDRLAGGVGDDTLYGGIGNDKLTGNNDNDTLYGEEGEDNLNGGNGDDFLYGGDDNDILNGARGVDTLEGGNGDDTLRGGAGDDDLMGEAGADTLDGGVGNDTLDGGSEDDFLLGRAGNDTLTGGTGNDILFDEDGTDTLNGGAGDDALIGGGGADILNGDGDNDILHGHGLNAQQVGTVLRANPNVVFNAETNSFYQYVNSNVSQSVANTAAQASVINGVAGHLVNITSAAENTYVDSLTTNDVWLGASDTTVEGEWRWTDGVEAGIQFWQGDNTGSVVNNMYENWNAGEPDDATGAGQDTAEMKNGGGWEDVSNNNRYVIEWDAGLMFSDNAIDTLNGGLGNDMLYGYGGADVLQGGDGNDTVIGGTGADNIDGGDGTDSLFGGDDGDTITGGIGDDVLVGGMGVDIMDGGADNDTFQLANGDFGVGESITGGAGTDDILLTNATTVDFSTGTIATVEDLNGSAGNDDVTYTFQQLDDFTWVDLLGGTDNSRVQANGTIDVSASTLPTVFNAENGFIMGSTGNDDLTITGAQINTIISGTGIIDFDTGTDVLNITSTSTDLNTLGATDGSIVGLEEIDASTAAAAVTIDMGGQTEDLILTGSANNDTITGGDGDDNIDGGSGADTIYGGDGGNTIDGGDGNDTIYASDNTVSTLRNSLSTEILADNPVLYYKMNETSGTNVINYGSLGSAVDGTLSGTYTLDDTDQYLISDGAIDFEGTSLLAVPDSTSINTAAHTVRTVELVFTADSTTGRQMLYEEGGNAKAFNIYLDGANIYFNARDNGEYGPFTITTSISSGVTYHAAFTFDSVTNNLFTGYLDGTVVGTGVTNTDMDSHGGDIGIGNINGSSHMHDGNSSGSSYNFDGRISDVAIYNSVLSATDIQERADIVAQTAATNTNTINDGDGLDTLYGSDEADIFVFDSANATNNTDVIEYFSAGQGDQLDISDLLTGFISGTSDINDFVQFTEASGNTTIAIDANGTTGGASFSDIAVINGVTGMNADLTEADGVFIV